MWHGCFIQSGILVYMQLPKNILALIEKFQAGTATAEEKQLLNEWYHSFNDSEAELSSTENLTEDFLSKRIMLRLQATIQQDSKLVAMNPQRKWQLPAAAVVFLIAIGAYFFFFTKPFKQEISEVKPVEAPIINDIAPGGNKALLTTTDGSTIILDSASNGTLIRQGNIEVNKLHDDRSIIEIMESMKSYVDMIKNYRKYSLDELDPRDDKERERLCSK